MIQMRINEGYDIMTSSGALSHVGLLHPWFQKQVPKLYEFDPILRVRARYTRKMLLW